MANPNKKAYGLIEGQAALIVIDIQAGTFSDQSVVKKTQHRLSLIAPVVG